LFLRYVVINGPVTISSNAFEGCLNLTNVTFASSTPSLLAGYSIFYNCGNLDKIYVPSGSLDAYKAMIIYDRVIIEKYLAESPAPAN
jgi:hypothetical protein